jgi:protein ImuB
MLTALLKKLTADGSPMRLACLHVCDLPLAAWLRADPELRGAAVVVADGSTPRARIVAVSAAARRRGVGEGMTTAQALAIASDLTVRARSAEGERAAHAALGDVAYSFSPRVEDGAPGTVWFDVGGLGALFASEHELAQAALRRAAALGLDAAVGIAGSKVSAELAARGGGCAVVPASEEWRVLAPLSLELLAPPPALRQTLLRWGIRTLGDLAALPASAVATRLGPEAAALARRARGEDAHPLAPRPLPLRFEEVAELDWGVDALEPFLFVVRGLLDRLIARLEVRGLVCGDLRLSLGLADRGRDERTVTVATPSNAVKALLTLVRVHLEAQPPRAAVETVRLAAVPERLRAAQLDLFRPAGPQPAQLAATLARLGALCGDAVVGAPQVADAHRPEAYGVAPFTAPAGAPATTPAPAALPLAVRAVRPPRPLEVFCQRDQPEFVRGDVCQGRVVSLAGPWRRTGDWWRPGDVLHRDYYDAHLTDGGVYRLYFERPSNQWFLDGVYD